MNLLVANFCFAFEVCGFQVEPKYNLQLVLSNNTGASEPDAILFFYS